MLNSILIDSEQESLTSLKQILDSYCPQIHVCGEARSLPRALELIHDTNPELVFFDIELLVRNGYCIVDQLSSVEYETIVISNCYEHTLDALRCSVAGYVVKPVQSKELIQAVNNASNRIYMKTEYSNNKLLINKLTNNSGQETVLGIPTIEGFEFIPIKEILRMEGLQKCTRVITSSKSDIISSYNLGEFRKILNSHRFFSPHKSHLINLDHIRKYHREGTIMMIDGSFVPVAKRKKKEFLNQIDHV